MDITVEAIQSAISMYVDDTKSMEDIGEVLGVSYSTVRRQLIACGVPIRDVGRGHTALTVEQEQEMVKRYKAGYTARALSEIYALPLKRVEKILQRLGVRKKG